MIGEADPFLARLLLRFAEACGLRGVNAQTGHDVLALVQRERPAVVILDSELPGRLRGWEVIRAIKAHPELRHIPLIHCSWNHAADTSLPSGQAVAHLSKPGLRYADFVAALCAAGVTAEIKAEPADEHAVQETTDIPHQSAQGTSSK